VPRSCHLGAAGAALLALALPASAGAAYAPKLAVKIDPATPGTPPAVTSTVTQASGETPNKTVKVSFPAGFTAPYGTAIVGTCSADQESQHACPDDSKIGAAHATASVFGLPVQLDGTVHYGGVVNNSKIKLIVFLDNAMFNQHQRVEGFVSVRAADGGFDTVFDALPNTLTTNFTLALDGAPHSLVVNPTKCGDYTFNAAFTSQQGEQATSSSTVTISGCVPPKLVLSPLDLAPERPRAGKGTTLTYQLSEDADVIVTVKHGGKQVQRSGLSGHAGVNRLRRLGRTLHAGRYVVRVAATTRDRRFASQKATLVVRKHH
jgi:hypothetical protein